MRCFSLPSGLALHRVFLLILSAYLALGFAFSLVNPPYEGPDEELHYANIRYLLDQGRLPEQEKDAPKSKSHQPPLYYLMGAASIAWLDDDFPQRVPPENPFWGYRTGDPGVDNKSIYLHDPGQESWPYRGSILGLHVIRWLSLALSSLALVGAYGLGREVFPHRPAYAWGATALLAFNPMFIYISGCVHNDGLVNPLGALTLWAAARTIRRGLNTRRSIALGLTLGLALLSKLTAIYLAPVVALALWWGGQGNKEQHEPYFTQHAPPSATLRGPGTRNTHPLPLHSGGQGHPIRHASLTFGLTAIVAGWWFLRNLLVYGEPTSMVRQVNVWGTRPDAPTLRGALNDVPHLLTSFWGRFSFGQIPLPAWLFWLLNGLSLVAVAGLVRHLYRTWRAGETVRLRQLLTLCLAIGLALAAIFARMIVSPNAYFGRYAFSALAAIGLCLFVGLAECLPGCAGRPRLALVVNGGLVALCLGVLVWVIAPAYAPPPVYASVDEATFSRPVHINFDDQVILLGYDLEREQVRPGDTLHVTLYWQVLAPFEHQVAESIQLLQHDGTQVAHRDTLPGLGRYPTTRWQPGQIIQDTIPVTMDKDAVGPTGLWLVARLYNYESGDELPAFNADGAPLGESFLGRVKLRGEQDAPSESADRYELGQAISLVEARWSPEAQPGETLTVTLTWRGRGTPTQDYTVFVHLFDQDGQRWAQHDGPPQDGAFPSSLWEAGDLVNDPHPLALGADLPPGQYVLWAGMYALETGERLPVTFVGDGDPAPQPNGLVPLGELTVSP